MYNDNYQILQKTNCGPPGLEPGTLHYEVMPKLDYRPFDKPRFYNKLQVNQVPMFLFCFYLFPFVIALVGKSVGK